MAEHENIPLWELADFAAQRAGKSDPATEQAYHAISEKIASEVGEPVLVVTALKNVAKPIKLLKPALAKMHGGAYMPHEREIAIEAAGLGRTSLHFWAGEIASGGVLIDHVKTSHFMPPDHFEDEYDVNKSYSFETAWLIPTRNGYARNTLYAQSDNYGEFRLQELENDTFAQHVDLPIPVYDFRSDFKKNEPGSALGREARTPKLKVDGDAAKWKVGTKQRTDILVGAKEIIESDYSYAYAALMNSPAVLNS